MLKAYFIFCRLIAIMTISSVKTDFVNSSIVFTIHTTILTGRAFPNIWSNDFRFSRPKNSGLLLSGTRASALIPKI